MTGRIWTSNWQFDPHEEDLFGYLWYETFDKLIREQDTAGIKGN